MDISQFDLRDSNHNDKLTNVIVKMCKIFMMIQLLRVCFVSGLLLMSFVKFVEFWIGQTFLKSTDRLELCKVNCISMICTCEHFDKKKDGE